MKPCISCGHAIANNAVQCDQCQTTQSMTVKHEFSEPTGSGKDKITTSDVFSFLVESAVRMVVFGMFAIPICVGILFCVVPARAALIAGVTSGIIISFCYTAFEFYIRFQPLK